MNYREIELREYIVGKASADSPHDLSHTERVVHNASKYAAIEAHSYSAKIQPRTVETRIL
jgi:hypothetical protein